VGIHRVRHLGPPRASCSTAVNLKLRQHRTPNALGGAICPLGSTFFRDPALLRGRTSGWRRPLKSSDGQEMTMNTLVRISGTDFDVLPTGGHIRNPRTLTTPKGEPRSDPDVRALPFKRNQRPYEAYESIT
jgi:hypothetical protein